MKVLSNIILSSILLLLFSCQKYGNHIIGEEIGFSAGYSVSTEPGTSKAALFEDLAQLQDKSGNGGFFRVEAFKAGSSDKHFTLPTVVMYFTDVVAPVQPYWSFYDGGTNLEERYWPHTYNLDFLAYMPLLRASSQGSAIALHQDKKIDPKTFIIPSDYDTDGADKGPTFICENLPVTESGQTDIKEFIYSWVPDQSLANSVNGKVPLTFVHPLSAVSVKISDAHAGTVINEVGFANIHNNGTLHVATNSWSPVAGSQKTNFQIAPNHHIPDNIPIGHEYGEYLVMPQTHGNDVLLFIKYTWKGTQQIISVQLNRYTAQWVPGKKYVYSVAVGESLEDIKVNVSVNQWGEGTTQEIEVK